MEFNSGLKWLNSALDGGGWSALCLGHSTPCKNPVVHLAGGGAVPDRRGKLCLRQGLNAEHSNQ